MQTSKFLKKVLLWAIGLLVLNGCLNYAMTPAYGSARVMWNEYEKENELDMIYIGSSVTQMNINPYCVDEVTGHNSYNMGTAGQSPENSEIALRKALQDHKIRTVVYGVAYSTFNNEQAAESQIAFGNAYKEITGIREGIQMDLSFLSSRDHLFDATSIQYYMPWTVNHCSLNPKAILANVKEKLTGVSAGESLNRHTQEDRYVGKGFEAYDGTLNYDWVGDNLAVNIYDKTFYEPAMKSLENIITMCQENDVELIVVNPPKPEYDIISFGKEYDEMKSYMEEFLGSRGVLYVDFGLARKELFESKPEYYHNFDHLTKDGADAFSTSLGTFLKAYENGENINDLFYSYEEFLESYEHISSVTFQYETKENGLVLKPQIFAGRHVSVHSVFTVTSPNGEKIDWVCEGEEVLVPVEESGNYGVVLRVENNTGEEVRTCDKVIRYYPEGKE